MSKQISVVQKQMEGIIKENESMFRNYGLLNTINGVGPQTAFFMIAYTANFTKFKSWRKFASYCGIAPFPNRSGTSVRGRTKISHLANKEGKVLFHLCAMTAIQCVPEMRVFYQRRLKEGKNEMSTLNIVRNKLLARAFAVVKRGTPYVDTMGYAA
ncbi:transposase [Arenibacter latericius]|uniref:transposase n=1 Tax=Arenibacter latericius TaxID=86104 RepID=UPI00146A8B8D|nr:transposase [Arenibacter latericius]